MKEAISKYTALEVLHVVVPKREERGKTLEPRETPGQDVEDSGPPCRLVRAAREASSPGPGAGLLTGVEGKGHTAWAMGGFWLGEVCT